MWRGLMHAALTRALNTSEPATPGTCRLTVAFLSGSLRIISAPDAPRYIINEYATR